MKDLRGRELIVALVTALALCPSSASAGTYTVLSCRDRTGAPTPSSDASGGWTAGNSGQVGLASIDRCGNPGGDLSAVVSGPWSYPVGARAWWRFQPPQGTIIESYAVRYAAYTRRWDGRNQGVVDVFGSASGYTVRIEGAGSTPPSWVHASGLHDGYLQFHAQCDGPVGFPNCDPDQVHAEVHVDRSEITLADTQPPSAGPATGSAVASPVWQGTELFAFPVADQGGGVYQAILEVDGATVLSRTIDDWSGRCVDTTAGERVFGYPQPCPGSTDAVVPVDANALPAGEHDVTLRVSDAAGNLRTVYSARKTIVAPPHRIGPGSDPAERGAANGENASDKARLSVRWAKTKRGSLIAPYGRRNVIRGRLTTAAGAGIRSAKIELVTAIDGRRAAALDKGGARTRRDGRFTLILPRNVSSRALTLRYRSHLNDTVSIAEAALRLKVRAGVKLRVAPHTATRGRSVRLRGHLVGKPIPRGGKVVELQARNPGGRWITFRTIRAKHSGRFATRYIFQRGGPAVYEMRARIRAADDYPYATGASHVARVRVR
jgi:hypothetical protein